MDKILVLLNLLSTILEQAGKVQEQAKRVSDLIKKAREEGRDITEAELEELIGEDDVARAALDAAIAKAKAEGR